VPREDAIMFGDLIGKLDMLRVECPKCGRSGRYRLADLMMRYGRSEKLFAFMDDVAGNCARRRARSDSDSMRRGLPRSAESGLAGCQSGSA
jgi:hypothetical protein